jgi:hypothetical protein
MSKRILCGLLINGLVVFEDGVNANPNRRSDSRIYRDCTCNLTSLPITFSSRTQGDRG